MLGTDSGSHPDTHAETKLAPAFGVASPTQMSSGTAADAFSSWDVGH
jgi:hypothetical protein